MTSNVSSARALARPGLARPGLYAITPDRLAHDTDRLCRAVAGVLAGGARIVQYRDKSQGPDAAGRRLANARALAALCRAAGVPLLINDDLELAEASGADGVHLGLADATLADARRRLGPAALLGATCHGSFARAAAAVAEGADYVAFGAVHASRSKPDAPRAGLDVVARAARALPVPVCAIGGLTPDNAAPAIAAGARFVAAIDSVFGDAATTDVEVFARAAARRFAALWPPAHEETP